MIKSQREDILVTLDSFNNNDFKSKINDITIKMNLKCIFIKKTENGIKECLIECITNHTKDKKNWEPTKFSDNCSMDDLREIIIFFRAFNAYNIPYELNPTFISYNKDKMIEQKNNENQNTIDTIHTLPNKEISR